jgi:hypothetical protein
MPKQEGSLVRTIVLSREQGWLELNLATGESVPRTKIPERSLRSLAAQPVDAVDAVAVDAVAVAIAAQ